MTGTLGSRSSVILDLEGDGDLDVVTNELHSEPQVLVSDLSARQPAPRWLGVRLVGTRANRDGLGAKVTVTAGGLTQAELHDGASGYLSHSLLPLYFGLGSAAQVDRVEVRWPSGATQTVPGPIAAGQVLEVVEPAAP